MQSHCSKRRSRAKGPGERKRAQYVSEACASCKRRKARCNGKAPCDSCEKHSIDCHYLNTSDALDCCTYEPAHGGGPTVKGASRSLEPAGLGQIANILSSLHEKVALLEQRIPDSRRSISARSDEMPQSLNPQNTHILRRHTFDTQEKQTDRSFDTMRLDGIRSDSPPLPGFSGPTSSHFSFGIARMILEQERGETTDTAGTETELAGSIVTTEEDAKVQGLEDQARTITFGPLCDMELSEVLRLIRVYDEVVGILHPIVDPELMRRHAEILYTGSKRMDDGGGTDFSVGDDDLRQLKMVITIALLAEGGGYNRIAVDIHSSLQSVVAQQIVGSRFTLQGQILLLLTSISHMFQEDCRLASRLITIASRLIIEAGLHRKQILLHRFPENRERRKVITVLYTSIILDRQLNFAAGLPFTLKDTDIDIPEVEDMPYAKAMASYVRFGAQAWYAVTDDHGRLKTRPKDDVFDYLEYQVRRWQESLPEDLRHRRDLSDTSTTDNLMESGIDWSNFTLRSILDLRANQIKILVLRPLLFSPQTITSNSTRVAAVADVARDTIHKLIEIDKQSDIYRNRLPILNHFLSSALSTLFLVYVHYSRYPGVHASVGRESLNIAVVREGIVEGLSLVKSYSSCRSSQRLWNKFAGPQGLLFCLGFLRRVDDGLTSTSNTSLKPSHSTGTASENIGDFLPNDLLELIESGLLSSPPCHGTESSGNRNGSNLAEFTDFTGEFSPLSFPDMSQMLFGNDFDVFLNDML